jgi:hypothetical protein
MSSGSKVLSQGRRMKDESLGSNKFGEFWEFGELCKEF